MTETKCQNYGIFGGAITVDLPSGMIDASNLRQVPDQQEVFLSPNSDLSIIIEQTFFKSLFINNQKNYLRFHFESLSHDNSASSSTITNITLPPDATFFSTNSITKNTPFPILLEGQQVVSKFNQPDSEADQVNIWMSLWRLNGIGNGGVGTDLVMTINLPCPDGTSSVKIQQSIKNASDLFHSAAMSLRIVDWGLFA
ncbi:hypothetical protein PPACK8108_LOCUS10229 [Phakopsora pachyrhizi]|uniref:Uncharacterized protein n=1 Tax=Phakopsora pachyrhizi TaxID=170000 RepID=A0AAV0B0T9_PHAPC|nr:hypothetical protein PPACK8108_LOCUS10229 [Phakopsora pachyrhizi]